MSFEHGKNTTVLTDKGYLRGYKKDDIYHFFNVEYAKADRFKKPRELDSWDGVKEATYYGKIAKQILPDGIENDMAVPHRFWQQSEDCQNLNIWTPTLNDEKLSVVVWFHGGGFFSGSAIEQIAYDGFKFAKKANVVFVSVNHRLNILGYMDLRKYKNEYKHSVVCGSLDLIMSLKWIKKNIANFGGNPDDVTVFGQSGGGAKIITLMNMPEAKDLFHKALIMSGTLGNFMSDEGVDTTNVTDKCLELLNIDESNIDDIQNIDFDKLKDAYLKADKLCGNKGLPYLAPQRGIDYLGDPMVVGFSEFAKKIPVMIGSTFSEFNSLPKGINRLVNETEAKSVINNYFIGDTDNILKLFKKAFPNCRDIDLVTYDNNGFRPFVKEWVKKRVDENCAPTYMYLFMPEMGLNESSMPTHCADIPYFFNNTDLVASSECKENFEQLKDEVFQRFVSFIKTGDVNNDKYGLWYKCSKDNEYTYIFSENSCCVGNFDEELLNEINKNKKPFSLKDVELEDFI